jgi:hypothetical protein
MAWEKLVERNVDQVATFSGARRDGASLHLPFFETVLTVDEARRKVGLEGMEAEPSVSVLALHYLLGCDEHAPSGRLISFGEAPGGDAYLRAFRARTIERIASEFASRPWGLVEAGRRVNGAEFRLGSFAVQVLVFPKLPVTVVLWEGDDEVPASANVLFDSSAPGILATEDLAVAGAMVASRLSRVFSRLSSDR